MERPDIAFDVSGRGEDWKLTIASGEMILAIFPTKEEIESLKKLCEIMLEDTR